MLLFFVVDHVSTKKLIVGLDADTALSAERSRIPEMRDHLRTYVPWWSHESV